MTVFTNSISPSQPKIAEKADANLPQTAVATQFTVTGHVALFAIELLVGTVIQAQANATKLQYNPTNGATTDLCATTDINADPTRTRYFITSTNTDAMSEAADGAVSQPFLSAPLVLPPGVIELNCAASNTGTTSAVAHWTPLTPGATLV